jgi:hypothetical protein
MPDHTSSASAPANSSLRPCRNCRRLFVVCRSCDRGYGHCTATCRRMARLRQTREARARYAATDAGRAGNRERERRFRERHRRTAAVTDHSSRSTKKRVASPARIMSDRAAGLGSTAQRVSLHANLEDRLACVACGRPATWLVLHRDRSDWALPRLHGSKNCGST